MTDHAPTPWHTEGQVVVSTNSECIVAYAVDNDATLEQSMLTATRIVTAVNAHDALVGALQAVDADGLPAPQRKLVVDALKLAEAE